MLNIRNQKPVRLEPFHVTAVTGDFDPLISMQEIITDPLFDPVVQGQSVTVSDKNTTYDSSALMSILLNCMTETIDPIAEAFMKDLFSQTLIYFDKNTNLRIQDLFALQSGTAAQLPEPAGQVIYTPATDVIPTSREFLAGKCSYDTYFASLAYYARIDTLGFYFANEDAFERFKEWLTNELTTIASVLPPETNQAFAEFQKLTLNQLTESIILRNTDDENNDPLSFARTIHYLLMKYVSSASPAEYGILPFNVGELFSPKTIVFVNVEKHGRASAHEVTAEWETLRKSMYLKPAVIPNNKISRLTATARTIQKIQQNANAASNKLMMAQKAKQYKLRQFPTKSVDIAKFIKVLISKYGKVNRSENIYKRVKATFAKPNRRNPDDFNKQGKIVSTEYKPDIHLYIDTSGSISERNYQETVKTCIRLAKKLNINLYFNSFSHVISQSTKLNTKDKTHSQIYREFMKVPKVTGGTDFSLVWAYINASKKRKNELSIMITDFGYSAPNQAIQHPSRLYYAPCAKMDWSMIQNSAKYFMESVKHIEPNIRKRILN